MASSVRGWYSPDDLVSMQVNIAAERASLIVALSNMGDEDVLCCLTSLNVSQSYVSDMLAAVRAESLRRELLGNPVFMPSL